MSVGDFFPILPPNIPSAGGEEKVVFEGLTNESRWIGTGNEPKFKDIYVGPYYKIFSVVSSGTVQFVVQSTKDGSFYNEKRVDSNQVTGAYWAFDTGASVSLVVSSNDTAADFDVYIWDSEDISNRKEIRIIGWSRKIKDDRNFGTDICQFNITILGDSDSL
jgi:hypothetical protein